MTRILLAGDTDGDEQFARTLAEKAEFFDCDVIFQLGDWGYMWYRPLDEHRVERVDAMLSEYGIPFHFIDGNHEWWVEWERRGLDIKGTEAQPFLNNFVYHPRGSTWEWDGVKFMALGGAVSIDKGRHKEGIGWGPQETIKDDDVERAIAHGKVDVLLTHDAPELSSLWRLKRHLRENGVHMNAKLGDESRLNRMQLARVARAVTPSHWYHGHYHHSYREHGIITERGEEEIRIMGLDCNHVPDRAYYVFDTDEFKAGRQR